MRRPGIQNAKGDRHCCQSPCHRTSAFHPEGHRARFRRHAPLAPARACEFGVGHRGRSGPPASEEADIAFRPSVARFMISPEGETMEPCWIRFPERSIGFGIPLAQSANALGFDSSGRSLPPICRLRGPIDLGLVHQADPSLLPALARPFRHPVPPSFGIPRNRRDACASPWFRNHRRSRLPVSSKVVPESTCTRPSRVSC